MLDELARRIRSGDVPRDLRHVWMAVDCAVCDGRRHKVWFRFMSESEVPLSQSIELVRGRDESVPVEDMAGLIRLVFHTMATQVVLPLEHANVQAAVEAVLSGRKRAKAVTTRLRNYAQGHLLPLVRWVHLALNPQSIPSQRAPEQSEPQSDATNSSSAQASVDVAWGESWWDHGRIRESFQHSHQFEDYELAQWASRRDDILSDFDTAVGLLLKQLRIGFGSIETMRQGSVLHDLILRPQPEHEDLVRILHAQTAASDTTLFDHLNKQIGKAIDQCEQSRTKNVINGRRALLCDLYPDIKSPAWCPVFGLGENSIRATISRGQKVLLGQILSPDRDRETFPVVAALCDLRYKLAGTKKT